uniref:Transmembrane protein 116 n=1 Tax=Varanus komodoensis TaxID=61221 RepID=A0A8D2JCL5_VARKO
MTTLSLIWASVCAQPRLISQMREVRPLFYLSLSDLFLGGCWLTGALLYSKETAKPTSQELACYNLQAAAQIFYVASFLYTVNYTWHLYTDLKVKYNQNLHSREPRLTGTRSVSSFSSFIPVLLVVPTLGLGNHYECYQNFTVKHGTREAAREMQQFLPWRRCSHGSVIPVRTALASPLPSSVAQVLLIRARALYKRFVSATGYVGDRQWAMIRMVEQGVVLYPTVFFCCWGPASVLGIVKLAHWENVPLYMALSVLEALTASSQGLLNCAVYSWTQHMFHCMKRQACRDVDTQTPLLRSQKRFYASTLPAHAPAGGVHLLPPPLGPR